MNLYYPSGPREANLIEAADTLLDARRTMRPLVDLPAALVPQDMHEVYFVQDRIAEALGPIGGWKIGKPTPDAVPTYAPMPLSGIGPSGSLLSRERHSYRGLEAEIAFLVGRDLPPRDLPYSREEVIAAMASCHPAIEVLEPAFADPTTVPPLAMLADLQMHGGFVYGRACAAWETIDFTREQVVLAINGVVRVERTGSNTSGDLVGLLPYLANQCATRTGGLRAGQWITTGSWTGNTQAMDASSVDVHFSRAGRVSTRFE